MLGFGRFDFRSYPQDYPRLRFCVLGAATDRRSAGARVREVVRLLLWIEDCVDVSRTMQHTDDIDAVIARHGESNVPPDRKTAHARRQFVAGTAHHRLRRQLPRARTAGYPSTFMTNFTLRHDWPA